MAPPILAWPIWVLRQFLASLALVLLYQGAVIASATDRGMQRVPIEEPGGQEIGFYTESHALLIGVSDYDHWPDLPGVVDDIIAVRQALVAQGFHIVPVDNPDSEQLKGAYQDFILRYGKRAGARLLFYFAGHGHTQEKAWGGSMGYIVPHDAPRPAADLDGFLRKAMDMKQMEVHALNINAKHALFLFDSCFSGSVFSVSRAIPKAISEKTARPVRQFITAGNADEEVPDHSVFRRQLVAALSGDAGGLDADGYITGRELGEYLQQSVVNLTNAAQHPQYGTIRHGLLNKGDFVFRLPPGPPPPASSATARLQVNVNVPVAQVWVDDRRVGEAASGRPLHLRNLRPASVDLRVTASGYQAESRRLELSPGWNQPRFQLLPIADQPPSPPPLSPVAQRVPPTPQAIESTLGLSAAQRRAVQAALNTLGQAVGAVDGDWGPNTRRGLRSWQRGKGQAVTGYLDATTYAALLVESDQSRARQQAQQQAQTQRRPTASSTNPGRRFRDALSGGGQGPEMVVIPAGSFEMGANNGDGDEKPVRRVRISRAFALGRTEVSFADYDRFCTATGRSKPDDSGWGRGSRPVINVSWNDAQAYAKWLSRQTGERYRLPTEAEWEYAARAGSRSDYWWGNQASHEYANYGKDACCGGLAKGRDRWEYTAPVGSFPANPFGLHDTAGNVWEWVADWHGSYPSAAQTDPTGPGSGSGRVLRGGSWFYTPRKLRSANRNYNGPGNGSHILGFRLARQF